MKNTKLIFLSIIIALFSFASCENDEPIVETQQTTKSVSIKSAMNKLQNHFNEDGTLNTQNNPTKNILFDYGFKYQFPVTFSFNAGTEVKITDFVALVDVVSNMTETRYIDGISFPFSITTYDREQNAVITKTITNETGIEEVINSPNFDPDPCDYLVDEYAPVCAEVQENDQTYTIEFMNMSYLLCAGFTQEDVVECDGNSNPDYEENTCFNFVYPISITYSDGTVITVNSDQELELAMYNSVGNFDFVYPFDVVLIEDGSTVTVNNIQEFYLVLDNCFEDTDPCEDNTIEAPIGDSVQIFCAEDFPTILDLSVSNTDGYSDLFFYDSVENQLTPNDTLTDGMIILVTQGIGDCAETLEITIVLEDCNTNPCEGNTIEAPIGDSVQTFCTGNFTTILDLIISNTDGYSDLFFYDSEENQLTPNDELTNGMVITVTQGIGECAEALEITIVFEDCTNYDGCWEFIYPITITNGGDYITINNDEEFNANFNPSTSTLIYPFNVSINDQTIVIETPNYFYEIGEWGNQCTD